MCGFVAVATELLITHHCLLSILDGLDFMFGEKHWKRGAVKCPDTLMEGMVDYRRLGDFGDLVKSAKTLGDLRDLGDLQFGEICWNWNCCRFTWKS